VTLRRAATGDRPVAAAPAVPSVPLERACPTCGGATGELIPFTGPTDDPKLYLCESCDDRRELAADGMLHRIDEDE
jgi:hypothetical protein